MAEWTYGTPVKEGDTAPAGAPPQTRLAKVKGDGTLDFAFLPLYPGSERDTGTEDWALASRTTMATRLEGIFGRRILENSGDPIL